MRYVLLAVGLLCTVVLLALFFARPKSTLEVVEGRPATTSHPTAPAVDLVSTSSPHSASSERLVAIPARELQAAVAPSPDSDPAPQSLGARSIVFGRVIDEDAHPVIGAFVYLDSADGTWAEGEPLPFRPTEAEGVGVVGFSATTDSQGRFRFAVPVPTASWINLHCKLPSFLGLTWRNFGPAGGRNEPRLMEGENDLGDIVVAVTGSVRGRVTSADGVAIATSLVLLEDDLGELTTYAQTASDGHFELGHVPAGTWVLSAQADGWLSGQVSGVLVHKRETTDGVVFILQRAPSIAGVVVDERGQPLDGINIFGWPQGEGQGAGALSDAFGRFTIFLPQNEPYFLEVQDAQDFESWGGMDEAYALAKPGDFSVRIELHRAARTTFVVVDAATNAPVTHFGIRAREKHDELVSLWSDQEPPEVVTHESNEVSLPGAPGQVLVALAPGYAPLEVDVKHDPDARGRQTLRLTPGGALIARIVGKTSPLAGALVQLERDVLNTGSSTQDTDDEWADQNATYDLGLFPGRQQILYTKPDGTIRAPNLAAGTYTLRISSADTVPRVLRRIRIDEGRELDLGDVTLDVGGRVVVRVILKEGLSTVGLEVLLDDGWDHIANIAADGTFRFDGVAPGRHTVSISESDRPPVEFVIGPGEIREVVISF